MRVGSGRGGVKAAECKHDFRFGEERDGALGLSWTRARLQALAHWLLVRVAVQDVEKELFVL